MPTRRLVNPTRRVVNATAELFFDEKEVQKKEEAGCRGLPPPVWTKVVIWVQKAKSEFFILTFHTFPYPSAKPMSPTPEKSPSATEKKHVCQAQLPKPRVLKERKNIDFRTVLATNLPLFNKLCLL